MLAFVHIPKTAGTTLHKIIAHQYPWVLIHHDTDGPPDAALAARIREHRPEWRSLKSPPEGGTTYLSQHS